MNEDPMQPRIKKKKKEGKDVDCLQEERLTSSAKYC